MFLQYGNGLRAPHQNHLQLRAAPRRPERRRLHNMVAKTANGRAMMDNVYGYDKVNNIKSLINNAPVPTSSLMGGSSEFH